MGFCGVTRGWADNFPGRGEEKGESTPKSVLDENVPTPLWCPRYLEMGPWMGCVLDFATVLYSIKRGHGEKVGGIPN